MANKRNRWCFATAALSACVTPETYTGNLSIYFFFHFFLRRRAQTRCLDYFNGTYVGIGNTRICAAGDMETVNEHAIVNTQTNKKHFHQHAASSWHQNPSTKGCTIRGISATALRTVNGQLPGACCSSNRDAPKDGLFSGFNLVKVR